MKKANKIIKITVVVLLSLTLITTCVVSGLFAKYVTVGDSLTTIGLKKFGVTVEMWNGEAFDDNIVSTVDSSSGTATVTIKNFDIGPGDDFSDAVHFKITGASEVPVKVTIGFDVQYTESDFKPFDDPSGATVFPFGITFMGYNSSGTKLTTLGLTDDYFIAPCSDSLAPATVGTALAGTGCVTKNFAVPSAGTTNTVIIHKKGNTKIAFNEFAMGFKWPFTYSNGTYSQDKFNEINTFYGVRGTFPLTVRIYVRVEQVQSV